MKQSTFARQNGMGMPCSKQTEGNTAQCSNIKLWIVNAARNRASDLDGMVSEIERERCGNKIAFDIKR